MRTPDRLDIVHSLSGKGFFYFGAIVLTLTGCMIGVHELDTFNDTDQISTLSIASPVCVALGIWAYMFAVRNVPNTNVNLYNWPETLPPNTPSSR